MNNNYKIHNGIQLGPHPRRSVEDPEQDPWLQVLLRLRSQSGLQEDQEDQDPHWLQP